MLNTKVLDSLLPGEMAAGFEHSVANMYFIPAGLAVKSWGEQGNLLINPEIPTYLEALTWKNFLIGNLFPVTPGNIVGGGLFVGLAYWFIYSSKWTRKSKQV